MAGRRFAARAASPADAEAIARIYNEGIADRIGTFETEPRSTQQIEAWFDGRHPIVVVEEGREVVAFASTSAYRARPCYAGIAEFSVYVARSRRGAGAGRIAMAALLAAAEAAGYWKLLSRIFPGEHGEPRADGKARVSRSRHLPAARQAGWRVAGLRDRRAPARRSRRMTARRSVVVSTLGITQTLAWGST